MTSKPIDNSSINSISSDYVATISTPLMSRYKIGESLNLAVQEVEQTDTGTYTQLGTYAQLSYITRMPEPFEIGKRQLLPQQSAVRFLVKRKVAEESFEMVGTSVTSTAHLRVALQARVEWELGSIILGQVDIVNLLLEGGADPAYEFVVSPGVVMTPLEVAKQLAEKDSSRVEIGSDSLYRKRAGAILDIIESHMGQ
jgi:hypothetical protein